jgi:mono/diheme cytochrome c family protein
MRKLLVIGIVAMALTAIRVAAEPAGQGTAPTAAAIKAGQKVYADQKCSTCHSVAGVGSKMAPLDGVGTKLTPADIRSWMTDPDGMAAKLPVKPKVKMKKYALPDADLDALVAYLSSLKK